MRRRFAPKCDRDSILVGKSSAGEVRLPGYGRSLLIAGQSGSGKSSLVRALLESITEKKYQICLVDPEGDYENLPGYNMFVQVAGGIDAETWQFHLQRADYSNWFRRALKDPELADQIAAIEEESGIPDIESRKRIKEAVLQKYSAPA